MIVDTQLIAKPILKWAGGKTQLINEIDCRLPSELKVGKIKHYCEPFLGGGAVLFHIIQHYLIEKVILLDINEELILFYQVVKNHPHELIDLIDQYKSKFNSISKKEQEKFFYEIRNNYNSSKHEINFGKYDNKWITRAAQLLFLNKTCFNGLFRLNSKGDFNVPFGKYKNPQFYDKDNILLISRLLQNAELFVGDFECIETFIDDTFFVYFDPPYRPISKTSSFTSYTKNDFDEQDQIRLAELFKRLDKKGAKLMLSNSDPKNINPDDNFFETYYCDFKIERVLASRMINSNSNGRGKINELIITNY